MASRTAIIFFILSLSPLHGFSQTQPDNIKSNHAIPKSSDIEQEIDSLKGCLKNAVVSDAKAEIYGQLCSSYASALGNVTVARQYADSVKWIANTLKSEPALASSDYHYGLVERYEGKYPRAIDHFQRHLNHCRTSGDSTKIANTLFQLAVVQQALGNYEESLAISYEAIKMFEENGSAYGMAITFMHIGILFGHLEKVDQAISMYHQTLSIFDKLRVSLK